MIRVWRERLRIPALVTISLVAVGLALMVGYAIPDTPLVVVGGVVVLLVGVASLTQPVLLPLLAMPLIVVGARVGGGGVDLPVATLALGLAFWPAVLFAPRPFSVSLNRLLWLNAIYQAATLFTVLANPFVANTIDWFHSWLMVSGALIVGWAVGRAGGARAGMRLFLAAVMVIALAGVAEGLLRYAQGNFSALFPSWPFSMHKNFFGTLACFGALVFFARPRWLGLHRWAATSGFIACIAAMGVSQSRQAIVALAVGLVIIAVRGRSERRRAWLGALIGVPALVFVATLVREQIESGNKYNSFFQRLAWYDDSIVNWQTSPLFGLGLRYWTEGRGVHNFHPPQVFLEVLATTGIVGLAGFFVMLVGMLWVLWRLPGLTGALALALVMARFVQGQLDIFWLSPTTAIPFLLAGLCLGVLARDSQKQPTMITDLAGTKA